MAGHAQPRGKHGQFARKISTAERDGNAARLKADGRTYQEIADELGFATRGAACRAVQRALDAAVVPAARLLRMREFARLELLWEALEPGVEAGDVKSITEARKVSESLRRLFDLDGPAEDQAPTTDAEQTAIDKMLADADAFLQSEQAKIYGNGAGNADD